MAGYGPGSPGGSYSSYTSANSITISDIQDAVSIDPKLLAKIEKMDRNFETIMDRLAVLDDPTAEKLERYKMLREAYLKYKFLEKLCNEADES